jgi:hypothetical protein
MQAASPRSRAPQDPRAALSRGLLPRRWRSVTGLLPPAPRPQLRRGGDLGVDVALGFGLGDLPKVLCGLKHGAWNVGRRGERARVLRPARRSLLNHALSIGPNVLENYPRLR